MDTTFACLLYPHSTIFPFYEYWNWAPIDLLGTLFCAIRSVVNWILREANTALFRSTQHYYIDNTRWASARLEYGFYFTHSCCSTSILPLKDPWTESAVNEVINQLHSRQAFEYQYGPEHNTRACYILHTFTLNLYSLLSHYTISGAEEVIKVSNATVRLYAHNAAAQSCRRIHNY